MKAAMTDCEISRVVRTNAGMCALWQPESFEFEEFEDWEDWATDDQNLVVSTVSGLFIPVNVGGGGVFQIAVHWGEGAGLTASEQQHLLVSSEPYMLISRGWFVLGGLEDVGDADFTSGNQVPLVPGRYAVTIHLIDWKADPASVDEVGKPTESALPDFVITLGIDSGGPYRTKVQTFERK